MAKKCGSFWEAVTATIIAVRRPFRIDLSDRLRLGKPSRKHPKRHGENKERSFLARQKARKIKDNLKARQEAYNNEVQAARLFWSGV